MLQRQRLVSFLIFLIGVSLLYFTFWDFFGETMNAYQAFQKANTERQNVQMLVSKAPDFKKQFEDLSNRAKIVFQAVPGNFDSSLYIVTLQNIVSKSGLIMKSIAINNPDDKGVVMLSSDVVGSIVSYERVLDVIQKALPIFEVTQLSFKPSKALQTFSLVLATYINPLSLQGGGKLDTATDKLKAIQDALKVSIQGLQDDSLKSFRVNGDIPVSVPDASRVGRDEPFDAY